MMRAFVIMPFGDDVANDVYELCTTPICNEFDLEVYRADEIFTTNPIIDDITAEINRANVIIADISGKNANVFYELGMAHLLKRKQTIMITQDDFENIPFDIAHFRIIKYDNTIVGKSAYENQLRQTLRSILQDYGLIYREDFELIFNILLNSRQNTELAALEGLNKIPQPLHKNDKYRVYGDIRTKTGGGVFSSFGASTEELLNVFIKTGYVEISGNLIILTEKGKSFAQFLEERGVVCHYFNGHTLTKGFKPRVKPPF